MYTPRHDTQYEPKTVCSPFDCNMSASADALRFWALGLIDRNHHQLRELQAGGTAECTDGNPENNGTYISDAAHVLDHYGVTQASYDRADGIGWSGVLNTLARGEVVIAHGDYGSVPVALRGPISRTFTGGHSVLFLARIAVGGAFFIVVGDGLSDAWMRWPEAVARKYMEDFQTGAGLTFLRVVPRRLKASVPVANVRVGPGLSFVKLGTIRPTSRIHAGGTVQGGAVHGNRTWWRVWYRGKLAYVHSSVGKVA